MAGRHRALFGQRGNPNYRARHAASPFSFHNRGYLGKRRRTPPMTLLRSSFGGWF